METISNSFEETTTHKHCKHSDYAFFLLDSFGRLNETHTITIARTINANTTPAETRPTNNADCEKSPMDDESMAIVAGTTVETVAEFVGFVVGFVERSEKVDVRIVVVVGGTEIAVCLVKASVVIVLVVVSCIRYGTQPPDKSWQAFFGQAPVVGQAFYNNKSIKYNKKILPYKTIGCVPEFGQNTRRKP